MPFVPVVDTALIETVYEWNGQVVENTIYYKKATSPIFDDLAALTDEVRAYIVSNLLPALTSAIQLVRVVGTLLDAVDAFQVVNTTGLPVVGGAGAGGMPNNVALCISLKTAHRGRSARGRNFIAGLDNSYITDNDVSGTIRTAFETVYAGLRTIGVDNGWTMVVVSRFSGHTIVDGKKVPTPRAAGVTYPVTNALIEDTTVDSQRRRLPGRGT